MQKRHGFVPLLCGGTFLRPIAGFVFRTSLGTHGGPVLGSVVPKISSFRAGHFLGSFSGSFFRFPSALFAIVSLSLVGHRFLGAYCRLLALIFQPVLGWFWGEKIRAREEGEGGKERGRARLVCISRDT